MSATVTLLGNVGKDPVSDYTGSNTHRVRFSLAVNRRRGDEELTDWYDIALFGKLADTAEKHVTKGSKLLVIGKLEANKKDDGKTFLDVSAYSFSFVGPKPEGGAKPKADAVPGGRASGGWGDDSTDLPF